MGYIFIIIIIIVLTWPWWKGLLYRYLSGRMEDTVRNMMGMPSRKEERRQRKAQEKSARADTTGKSGRAYRRNRSGYSSSGQHIIPPEYAVDVEYTEIKEYSHTETVIGKGDGERVEWRESQIEDVEYTEIKIK